MDHEPTGFKASILRVVHGAGWRQLVGHPHFIERICEDTGRISQQIHILFIRTAVIEQIELDHFNALIREIK
jgi:hypothetical protein